MQRSSIVSWLGSGTPGPTVPGAPTNVVAVGGDAEATITFDAPSDGGEPITDYTVTSSPGGITANGASSPIVVTGLDNGTEYTFTVTATNSIGTGPASSPSNAVTPATIPGPPINVVASFVDGTSVEVAFDPPLDDGGDPITGYETLSDPGGSSNSGASSPILAQGLTTGVEYTFQVLATNNVGPGPYSDPSNPITPATVPGAPTIGTATVASATSVSVAFTPPVSDGGSAITGYTVTSSPGGLTGTGGSSPIVVSGLTTGVAYTFTVTATNAVGTGSASAASNSVTPVPPFVPSNWGTVRAWWSSRDPATITDAGGGAVSAWADKSANARNLSQGTGTARPHTGTRTFNSLNVIDFDGTDFMNSGSFSYAQPTTIMAIVQADATAADRYIISSASPSGPYLALGMANNSGRKWTMYGGTNLYGPAADTNAHILIGYWNGASSYLRIDGVQVAAGAVGSDNPTSGVTVGDFANFINRWDGWVGDLIMFQGSITLATAEQAASAVWGIAI